jgi:hypothetical protein
MCAAAHVNIEARTVLVENEVYRFLEHVWDSQLKHSTAMKCSNQSLISSFLMTFDITARSRAFQSKPLLTSSSTMRTLLQQRVDVLVVDRLPGAAPRVTNPAHVRDAVDLMKVHAVALVERAQPKRVGRVLERVRHVDDP